MHRDVGPSSGQVETTRGSSLVSAQHRDRETPVVTTCGNHAPLPFTWQVQQLWVTLSVGIAEAPLHSSDAQLLVKRADDALYAAKDAGKNKARVAD